MHVRGLFCVLLFSSAALSAPAGSPYATRGVTADGRVITAGPNTGRPWARDIIKEVRPQLSASERSKHHEGEGLFRVILDADNGTVRYVVIMRSSGYPAIDQIIVDSLRQWRLRPHRWRDFEIYVGLWLKRHGSNQSLEPTAGRREAHI
jgi:outer membrane biosynthesis protein TonB